MELLEGGKKKSRKEELIDMYYKALDEGKVETAGALVGSCYVNNESPIDMCRMFIQSSEDLRQLMILQDIFEQAEAEEEYNRIELQCVNELKREAFKVVEGGESKEEELGNDT